MDAVWPYLAALAPFLFAALAFYVIIKNIVTSDRNERIAQRRWEAEHGGMPNAGSADSSRVSPEDSAE
jgi:hypothetical protein